MADDLNSELDVIRIDNIIARGRHGATAAEKEQNLPLEINVELFLDLSKPATNDVLEDTVNYSTLQGSIVQLVETKSRNLIERLAQDILDHIFEDKRVRIATVQILKIQRLAGATPSVTLTRRNPH